MGKTQAPNKIDQVSDITKIDDNGSLLTGVYLFNRTYGTQIVFVVVLAVLQALVAIGSC